MRYLGTSLKAEIMRQMNARYLKAPQAVGIVVVAVVAGVVVVAL